MNLKSIWTYVLVFALFFAGGSIYFKYFSNNRASEVEDFDTFLERFLTDETFQMSRINFPLQGLPKEVDSLAASKGFFWQEKDWDMHKKVDYESLGLERKLIRGGKFLIREVLLHPQGVGYERRFMINKEGKWFLIYYSDVNAISKNNQRAS